MKNTYNNIVCNTLNTYKIWNISFLLGPRPNPRPEASFGPNQKTILLLGKKFNIVIIFLIIF